MANRSENVLARVALIIALIGAINWGLIGFFNFNLVGAIFGGGARLNTNGLSRFIYAIVGLCGLVGAYYLSRMNLRGVSATTTTPEGLPGRRTEIRP